MEKDYLNKIKYIFNKKKSVEEVCEVLCIDKNEVINLIDYLKQRGIMYEIDENNIIVPLKFPKQNKKIIINNTNESFKILALSDTHLCCKYQRLDLLNYIYEKAYINEVDYIIHCGDLTDGCFRTLKQKNDLFLLDYDKQVDYVINNYPKSNIPTYIVSGNHDLWWYNHKGKDIVKEICEERNDLIYLGSDEADICINNTKLKVIHGSNSHHSSRSKNLEKYIETSNFNEKPDIIFRGHSHYSFLIKYDDIYAIQVPALIDPFVINNEKFNNYKNFERGVWWINIDNKEKQEDELKISTNLENFTDKIIRKRKL